MMFPKDLRKSKYFRLYAYLIFVVLGSGILFLIVNAPYFKYQLTKHFDKNSSTPPVVQSDPRDKMTPNTLIIESLKINVPVVYVNDSNEDAFQKALIDGVVHYPGTVNPGDSGNDYIFGHSSDF